LEQILKPLDEILGLSPAIQQIKSLIRQIAASDITVLISGESGTGKELVARAIHMLSKRRNGSLVSVNCGAIPEGIFESEIFGHERGSFTSADQRRQGYFEMADKGSLLLDEIGEMPLQVQVKILRVLETGKFLRVGGSEELNVNVRVIAATNKDLQYETSQGHFRQDLYYRLKAVNITVPPLRERVEDIPILVRYFAKQFGEKNNRPGIYFDNDAIDIIKRHYWAGNVRELKNFIESMIALSHENVINANDVSIRLAGQTANPNLPILVNRPAVELDQELVYRTLLELRHEMNGIKGLLQQLLLRKESESHTEEIQYIQNNQFHAAEEVEVYALDEMEKEQIKRALVDFHGNRRKASEALGIGERTLYRKIKQYKLK